MIKEDMEVRNLMPPDGAFFKCERDALFAESVPFGHRSEIRFPAVRREGSDAGDQPRLSKQRAVCRDAGRGVGLHAVLLFLILGGERVGARAEAHFLVQEINQGGLSWAEVIP